MGKLDEAYAALQGELRGTPPNQTIDLVAAATRQPLGQLAEPLTLLRAGSSFSVTGATLSRPRDAVVLAGTATFLLPGQVTGLPVNALLTVTEAAAGTLAFTVALTVTKPAWTFADSFATLPHTLRSRVDAPGSEYGESTLKDSRSRTPPSAPAAEPTSRCT